MEKCDIIIYDHMFKEKNDELITHAKNISKEDSIVIFFNYDANIVDIYLQK
jgi:hypothetical protein